MGIKTTKVQLLAIAALAGWLLPLNEASLCQQGIQYWSNESEACVSCKKCDSSSQQVVIRPCQAHTDTVCGPVSALDIDWTWLKHKHHDKTSVSPSEKKHHKKAHLHHESLGDDQVTTRPFHHSLLDDEVELMSSTTHDENNNLKRSFPGEKNEPLGKRLFHRKHHHSPPENFLSEDIDDILDYKKPHKIPPPTSLKSADDLEKEWKKWLIQSKNQLQHRKDDLLKNLHRESPYNNKHHSINKLNEQDSNIFDDDMFPHNAHYKDHPFKKHFSPLELEMFDRLINHVHQRQERPSLSQLLGTESAHEDLLNILKSENKQHDKFRNGDDLGYPMDTFNFRSALPTHRLILGEPSTVSEIMDQDLSEDSEDETVRDGEDGDGGVVAVPFTAAERLVWDWQALALASAVAACLLFFTVVAVFSILHARQWRQIKSRIHNDIEEMSAKVSLMQSHNSSNSAAEASNTNLYLDKLLLENSEKKTSNIYTQKRPSS